ncbi:ATPase [Xylariaceae sp. FL0594]|nr:ATPase [Xylariaceae sp. FL0594]
MMESAQDSADAKDGISTTANTAPTADKTHGLSSTVKELYGIKKGKGGDKWTWTDKHPNLGDMEKPAENEETRAHAIILRKKTSQDSRKKLEAHSIIIQSPPLREALGHILEGYPGVACELQRLTFKAPFAPFIHRWTEFMTYMRQEDLDTTTKEHLALLHDTLKTEIGESIAASEDYILTKKIAFEDLWMIFRPGNVLVMPENKSFTAVELVGAKYIDQVIHGHSKKCFCLDAHHVDYDGHKFGRGDAKVRDIAQFDGVVNIPTMLIRRGELFEKIAGRHYRAYDGKAIVWNENHEEVPVYVDGRIVIDIEAFNTMTFYHWHHAMEWNGKDKALMASHMKSRTGGYSLKHKKWFDFYVDNISEIVWDANAYQNLVLPQDEKELILAFCESQMESTKFDDVISGEGKGVTCLLSGPPGVGKTLTAEAVAEHLRVPLHTLTAGDLGATPETIERELRRIKDLAARWKAVVLLDECDVFLKARASHTIRRNSTVSIFARMLEYYPGILFMTSTRVEKINPAVQSRIHVWLQEIKNALKTAHLLAARKKSPLKRELLETVLAITTR